MSLIQVELLRRKQQAEDLAKLEYPLGATIMESPPDFIIRGNLKCGR